MRLNKSLVSIIICSGLWILLSCKSNKVSSSNVTKNTSEKTPGTTFADAKKEREFSALFFDGMKSFMLGNYSDAIFNFGKALEGNPANGAANYMYARSILTRNEYQRSLTYIDLSLKEDPKNIDYYLLKAEVCNKMNNYAAEAEVYKKLMTNIPNTDEYLYNLADAQIQSRQLGDCLKTISQIEKIYGRNLDMTREKQKILLYQKKPNEAIAEGYSLMRESPEVYEYKRAQGEFLLSQGKNEEGEKLLQQVIREHPEDAYSQLLLVDLYVSKGDIQGANQLLKKLFANPSMDAEVKANILEDKLRQLDAASSRDEINELATIFLQTHPENVKARTAMAETYLLYEGKERLAWKEFIEARKRGHTGSTFYLKLAELDLYLQEYDSLQVHTDIGVENYPNDGLMWYYNGVSYSHRKQYKKAAEAFEQSKELSLNKEKLLILINTELGNTYHHLKEYKKSDNAFEEVLIVDKYNEGVLNNYAYFLSLRNEKLDKARQMAGYMITKYPNEATYLDTYAWVLYKQKEYQEAKTHIEKALEKTPDNGEILEHYGDVLYQLGNKEKALEYWKKAKKAGETSEWIDKKIADKKLYE